MAQQRENPAGAGLSEERMMGFEPTTFYMASRRSSQLSYIRASGEYSQGAGQRAALPSALRKVSAIRP